jgi:hypothetical protein
METDCAGENELIFFRMPDAYCSLHLMFPLPERKERESTIIHTLSFLTYPAQYHLSHIVHLCQLSSIKSNTP